MSNYLGNKCIVCGQKFDEKDDIVVCPECGTPYHRECYIKEGKCINEKLHESGKSWDPEPDTSGDGYKKCANCGTINKPHTIICENCGAPMLQDLNASMQDEGMSGFNEAQQESQQGFGGAFGFDPMDKCCGINPDEEFDDIKLKHIAEFVGTNQMYYIPLFKRMKDTGKKISLNIISMFAPHLYFAHRKMWLWTIITILFTTLVNLPLIILNLIEMMDMAEYSQLFEMAGMKGSLLENFSQVNLESLYNTLSYADLAFRVLLLLFSNWLYYRHCIRKVVMHLDENGEASAEALARSGGTSIGCIFISLAIQFVVTAIVTTVLMM
ncbi:MAG: hypothetical protein IJN85_04360 [Oscillospiraceae bacterium]|nr:hypothetical protein [Oscillospiraceae bacterium]